MSNVITANFAGDSHVTVTTALYQYDYGQILKFSGLELPTAYNVHFSNKEINGISKTSTGNADGVAIPDEYLLSGEKIYAWVFLHTGQDDGETVYKVTIPVRKRAKPTDIMPTPVQHDSIEEAIAALNAAVAQTGQDVATTNQLVLDASASASSAEASATTATNSASDAVVAKLDAETASTNAQEAATIAMEYGYRLVIQDTALIITSRESE